MTHALKTKNGYFINYHGLCFFVSSDMTYRPWIKTIQKGMLPPANEFGRLRKEGLAERVLTDDEEGKVQEIANRLKADPFWGLDRVTRNWLTERRLAWTVQDTAPNSAAGTLAYLPGLAHIKEQLWAATQ